ncbi:MAG: PLP-dependent aminotransferase family protein [Pseudomonadota bacterium]
MAIPAQSFFLDPAFRGTLQQQIRRMVVDGVLSGRLKPGERMPSSRTLAKHLGVSRLTVTMAYTDLVASDYLSAKGRSGYFISQSAPTPTGPLEPPKCAKSGIDWSGKFARRFGAPPAIPRPADWQRYPYPFIYGQTDPRLFDHQNWRTCALQALGRRDFDALSCDSYERDDPILIEYILRHILPRRGIYARPEEILLTLGSQNALWLSAQLLLGPQKTAVIEHPCYPGLSRILETVGCKVSAVDVDGDGLPPSDIPRGADAVFVTVSHQCPTNATMPAHRRRALLSRAEEDGFVVVEDDYELEISAEAAPAPSLKALDEKGVVVYVGSFSKSIFPGLRLGYLVAPEAFLAEARALRAVVLRHPPGHVQRTAAYFLSLGHYDAQVNRLAQAFRRRRAVLEQAIDTHGLATEAPAQFGAASAWLSTPEGVDARQLADRLRKRGVLIEPGDGFFGAAPNPDAVSRHYRVAFSSIGSRRISDGIAIIGEELRQMAPSDLDIAVGAAWT